jgi:hypothetical protein
MVNFAQPAGNMFFAREASEGFHGLRATTDNIELTVDLAGIGENFGSSTYDAILMNYEQGIVSKTYDFGYVGNDTIKMTILGGLEANPNTYYMCTKMDSSPAGHGLVHRLSIQSHSLSRIRWTQPCRVRP